MKNPTVKLTRCTIQQGDGSFCDAPSLESITYSVCAHHARKLYQELAVIVQSAQPKGGPARGETSGVVYYLRVGDLVKIGHTTSLQRRLRQYPPTAVLLATEPGGPGRERMIHLEFRKGLAAGREWFHPIPALMNHIGALNA